PSGWPRTDGFLRSAARARGQKSASPLQRGWLQFDLRAKQRFLDLGFLPAAVGVDEGVWRAGFHSRVLGSEVVLRRMIAERHIARQGAQQRERTVELALDVGR